MAPVVKILIWIAVLQVAMGYDPDVAQYSDTPPPPEDDWTHSVIFEPMPKMSLTRSSYQVTTFLDFGPFLDSFSHVRDYLYAFKADLDNPTYLQRIRLRHEENQQTPIEADETMQAYLQTSACRAAPFHCAAQLKIDLFKKELDYIVEVFEHQYHRFLSIIDHLDYHPTVTNVNRTKRSTTRNTPFTADRILTEREEQILDMFLKAMKDINPKLHDKLKRMKRFGLATWLLGWGVFSNSREIDDIKRTLRTYDSINKLQFAQIQHLAKHLNLTMTKVNHHSDILFDIDQRLLIMNKTIQDIMYNVNYLRFQADLLSHIQARIITLHTAMIALQNDNEHLNEFMSSLSTRTINPVMFPPDILRKILVDVLEELRSHPRLRLTHDPDLDVWSFYNSIKVTPIVLEDYLMLILTIPLIDRSLQLELYRAHNLPTIHPTFQIHSTYILEGEYLAIGLNGMYAAIPDPTHIKICRMTMGHLCMFDKPLYPVERITWCLYALFIHDKARINRDCTFTHQLQTNHMAYSLDGYLWAISSLVAEKIQIRCVSKTKVITVKPPLQIIDVGNGCEAFSANIYIPAKSELTATYQSTLRVTFFLRFNFLYKTIGSMLMWHDLDWASLTPEEIEQLRQKFVKLGPMDMELLSQTIADPTGSAPFSLNSAGVLTGLLIPVAAAMVMGIVCIFKRKTIASHLQTLNTLGPVRSIITSLLPQLVPSLAPTLKKLLPSPDLSTTAKTALSPLATIEEQILPETSVELHHLPHAKPQKADTHEEPPPVLPPRSATAPVDTSDITLEQFQKAAGDLAQQGFDIKKYKKYTARLADS